MSQLFVNRVHFCQVVSIVATALKEELGLITLEAVHNQYKEVEKVAVDKFMSYLTGRSNLLPGVSYSVRDLDIRKSPTLIEVNCTL